MYKEATYQEKFSLLKQWMPSIIEKVKKDLKNEHLNIDRAFCKKYFMGKNIQQLKNDEIAQAYIQDIGEGNVGLGEFIASRWLLKNTDLYGFFEEKLKQVNPDFDQLEELSLSQSQEIMQAALAQFGATRTYIFSLLNSVVFIQQVYDELRLLAENENGRQLAVEAENEIVHSIEQLRKRYEREIASLTDRYEKKLSGLQKKYNTDTETLKKQIAVLQRKLSEGSSLETYVSRL